MGDSRVAEYAIGLLPYKTKQTPARSRKAYKASKNATHSIATRAILHRAGARFMHKITP
jgi:hypothetical protein